MLWGFSCTPINWHLLFEEDQCVSNIKTILDLPLLHPVQNISPLALFLIIMLSQASWMHNLWCFLFGCFYATATFSGPRGASPLLPLAPWVILAVALKHKAGFCGVNVSAMGMKDRLTWLNQNKSLNKELSQTGEFVSIQWVLKCYITFCWRIFRLHA